MSFMKSRILPVAHKAALGIKKASPEIYVAFGIVAGIAGAVMAAKAYKKHEEVLEELGDEIAYVREHYKESDVQIRVKEMSPLYGEYTAKFVGLYGPPTTMGALSIYLILRGMRILKGRNEALFAAAKALETGYTAYRSRVIAEQGEEADERYRFGAEKKTITVSTPNEEGGRPKKTKHTVNVIPETFEGSVYAAIYDETNKNWSADRDTNYNFLKVAEKYFNDNLDTIGYVTLNDVWKYLRIPPTPAGQVVGWHIDAPGDNWIDLGINLPINREQGENRFIIDPNVNGVIYKYIGG